MVSLDPEPCGWNLREKVLFPRLKEGGRAEGDGGRGGPQARSQGCGNPGGMVAEITHQNLGNQIPLWPKAGLICSPHSPKVSFFTPSCDPPRRGHPSHPPTKGSYETRKHACPPPNPACQPTPATQGRSETGDPF